MRSPPRTSRFALLTLAELCIAQRSWPEAVDALEAVVSTSREASHKLTALFALASIYEKVLMRPEEVDRTLRAALAVDPDNSRALRALLRRIAAEPVEDDPEAQRAKRREIAEILARLSTTEKDPAGAEDSSAAAGARRRPPAPRGRGRNGRSADGRRGDFSAKRASLCAPRGDLQKREGAERRRLRTGARLGHRPGAGAQPGGRAVVARRWGQLEIDGLSRMRDGIGHLQRAVSLDPTLYETRFELASAFHRMEAHAEASRTLLGMLSPTARPLLSIADPAAGLALLERSLATEHRNDDAVVVSELRAIAGELDEGRLSWLRGRRFSHADGGSLDRATLVTHVLPPRGTSHPPRRWRRLSRA